MVVKLNIDLTNYSFLDHAYQSALLSVFLTSVHLVLLILHFPSFFNWCAILFDTFILGKTA